ncbi:MAG: hypothetical protein ACR2OU_16040, partial [Thermomicrobiales bacterium]
SIGTDAAAGIVGSNHCQAVSYMGDVCISPAKGRLSEYPNPMNMIREERREIWQHEFNLWYEIRRRQLRYMT